jgi:hypothetical protein
MDILNNLYNKYGQVSPAVDLLANEEKLHELYNPTEPIETMFD